MCSRSVLLVEASTATASSSLASRSGWLWLSDAGNPAPCSPSCAPSCSPSLTVHAASALSTEAAPAASGDGPCLGGGGRSELSELDLRGDLDAAAGAEGPPQEGPQGPPYPGAPGGGGVLVGVLCSDMAEKARSMSSTRSSTGTSPVG